MPRQARTSDEDLFLLCDDIQELEGGVTPARLREAAGGGGYNRLKAIVEAWRVRRDEAARRTGIEARERDGRDTSPNSKKQGLGGPQLHQQASSCSKMQSIKWLAPLLLVRGGCRHHGL